jgi:hypothetical protein
MNTAEIIVREMQGGGGFEMRQLLAVSIGQPRKPAKLHSEGEVLPFDKRCRDVLRVGITAPHFGYNLRDRSWGVPLIPKLAVVAVQLRQLSEVSVTSKGFLDSFAVEDVRIGGQLYAVIAESVIQIQHECLRVSTGTFADKVRRNEFRLGIERDENPLVAKVCRVVFSNLPLLLHQEAPNLVTLNAAAGQLAHLFVHHFLAALASQKQQSHDCVPVKSSESFSSANRATLKQALNCACRYVGLRQHRVSRQFGVRFAEGGFTGSAAPSLDSALTKVSKTLAVTVDTTYASHIGLVFPAGQADNVLAVGIAAHPACRLALVSAATEIGASFWSGGGPTRTGDLPISIRSLYPSELHPRKTGIQSLQALNALRLITHRWVSHSKSPFAWIGLPKSLFTASVSFCGSAERFGQEILERLFPSDGCCFLDIKIARIGPDLLCILPSPAKHPTQGTTIVETEQCHQLLVGATIAMLQECVNQLALIAINQPEKFGDTLLSPAGTPTRYLFFSIGEAFTGCIVAAFRASRKFERVFRGVAFNCGVPDPYFVSHAAYLRVVNHPKPSQSIVKEIVTMTELLSVENRGTPYRTVFRGVLVECETAEEALRLAAAIEAESSGNEYAAIQLPSK